MAIIKNISISQEAEQLINGERRTAYGPAEESFKNIGLAWTAVLKQRDLLKPDKEITGDIVAIMMSVFKLLRESANPKRDNRVDAIGYILLEEKILAKEF